MAFGNPIVGSGGALIRDAIRSRNYAQGVSGWSINKDGSAEFNNVAIYGGELVIQNEDGDAVASIDAEGTGSFQDLTVVNSPTLMGLDFQTEILDPLPRGLVARGTSTSFSQSIGVTPTEIGLGELSVTLDSTRSYRLTFRCLTLSGNNNNQVTFRLRYTSNGNSPTVSSTILFASPTFYPASGLTDIAQFTVEFSALTSGTYRLLATAARTFGSGLITLTGTSVTPLQIAVEDIGLAKPNTYVTNNGTGGTTPVDQYVSAHLCTWSRAYTGSGSPGSFSSPNSIYQGYNQSDSNGNRKSMIGFDWATIQSQLSGATVDSCTLTLYFAHWWFNSGGTAVIGYHNDASSSPPSSFNSAGSITTSAGWPKPGLRTVDLGGFGDLLKAGTAKGIVLGPGLDTSATYYGYANGFGMSNPPTLTITYTK